MKNKLDELKERVDRERKWHDDRFADDDSLSESGRFYNALSNWYEDYNRYFLVSKCSKALEVGAGLETLALKNEIHCSLMSIDISSMAIGALKSKGLSSDVKFEVSDAHDLPYGDGEFDLVFARGVLHHLDLEVGISELKRVLTADGKIMFGEPLAGNPLIQFYRFMTPHMRTPDERPLSYKDIQFVLGSFKGATVKYYGFVTLIVAIIANRPSLFAEKCDDFILNKLKFGRFLAWACLIHNGDS